MPSLAAAAAPPVRLQGLPAADFEKLPPGAQIDVGGRILTKSQFLAELEAHKQGSAAQMPRPDFASAKAKLLADEKAKVEAANAELRARWKPIAADVNAAAAADTGGPRIDRIDGQPITDAGAIGIHGSGFGTGPGEIHLLGPFPRGHINLTTCSGGFVLSAPIVYCDWRPHALFTTSVGITEWGAPPGGVVVGIPDQQLQVVVINRKGERSAPFPVAFRAHRVLQQVDFKNVSAKRSNPDEGPCQKSAYFTIECTEGRNHPANWHIGVDEISADLKNGWTLDPKASSATVNWTPNGMSAVGFEKGQLSFANGHASATAFCIYFTQGPSWTCNVDLWAVGPEGVPMK